MTLAKKLAILLALIAPLLALSNLTAAERRGAKQGQDVLTLNWEALMPVGEEFLVREMQNEYMEKIIGEWTAEQLTNPDGPGAIEEGSPFDQMPQLGTYNTIDELDGEKVRLPGFVVPLDFAQGQQLTRFLFVPYYGACIHTPPPPPNQIVYVQGKADVGVDDMWRPYWAEGTLRTERVENELGNAAYTLTLDAIYPYD